MEALKGKVVISGKLRILTGLHIGGSTDYSGIGAVDSVVARDVLTKAPYIPGSSLKGKLRYLTARCFSGNGQLKNVDQEDDKIKRLFGSGGKNILLSRLQFSDIFMNQNSLNQLASVDTGLYLTEIKFENTIKRTTAVANPRQIERVPAGTIFDFKLVYNVEKIDELRDDLNVLKNAMSLLEMDYLGGHGTRGYGRVKFEELITKCKFFYTEENEIKEIEKLVESANLGEV